LAQIIRKNLARQIEEATEEGDKNKGLALLRRLRYMGNTHGMVSNDTDLP